MSWPISRRQSGAFVPTVPSAMSHHNGTEQRLQRKLLDGKRNMPYSGTFFGQQTAASPISLISPYRQYRI